MKKIIFFFLLLSLVACDEVKVQPKATEEAPSEKATGFSNEFVLDNQGGLFKNNPWYVYEPTNHLIFPSYDIYAIKTPEAVYKIQFMSYYRGESESGVYTLKIQRSLLFADPSLGEGESMDVEVDAKGCGNQFSNPQHATCVADPEQNAFVYLDLETLEMRKMKDADGLMDTSWDLAFKTTDVRLNSGTTGPSTVVGAVIKKQAKEGFAAASLVSMSPYYLPEGVDRVINDKDWYADVNGLRVGVSDNYWTVQSMDGEYTTDVSFVIEDQSTAEGFQTKLQVQYVLKRGALGSAMKILTLDMSSNIKAPQYCIVFSTAEVYKCSTNRKDWDLKILGMQNQKNGVWTRDWRIFTGNGALGPF